MFNIILTILIAPFMPIFMYGHFGSGPSLSWATSDLEITRVSAKSVLGESTAKDENGLPASDNQLVDSKLLSSGWPANVMYMPVETADFQDINIWSHESVVIDVDSGTILHYQNGRQHAQIASLTKVMTATLTLENVKDLDSIITITPAMLNVEGTRVGCPTSVLCTSQELVPGEKISVRSLLTAMLLDSANDAATALGTYVGGTPKNFVTMMNAKAKSLGLQDTHFCTPSGLEIDGHEDECYSSAYDLARIAVYSLKYPLLWSMMRTQTATVYSADNRIAHSCQNTDELLSEMPDVFGGKTGFTPLAGKSLMLGATDPTGKHRVVAVVLNDESFWSDMEKLVNWTFENYTWKK
ncbi:MAG: serine hydrolase [Candidatus Pacebacteria bacterium]|nr:serine hydrolase [Candidatus Paceibacterota bacterium]